MKDSITGGKSTLASGVLLILVILACLVLAGCLGAQPTKSGADGVQHNPLRGLELDLTAVDVLASMMRMNNILLTRMSVSAEAGWPRELPRPEGDSQAVKAYLAWLEKENFREFDFFSYYGDVDAREIHRIALAVMGTAEQSGVTIGERGAIEALEYIAQNIIHQRRVVDYRPPGCGSPALSGRPELTQDQCFKVQVRFLRDCPFIHQPLEEQLFVYASKKDFDSWIDLPVQDKCLRQAEGSNVYQDFQAAFASLLPRHLTREIETNEREINRLSSKIGKLDGSIREAESKAAGTPGLAAKKKDLADMKKDLEAIKTANKKLYQQALQSVTATRASDFALARNLKTIIDSVNSSLAKAAVVGPTALGKMVYDIDALAKRKVKAEEIILAMAQEAVEKKKARNVNEAKAVMKKRFESLVKRAVTLIPNLVVITQAAFTQYDLIKDKTEYLDKLIAMDKQQR